MTEASTSNPPPREKAVLFCIDCGHESGITGDWVVREPPGRAVYECPDCGAAITTRSRPEPVCC